MKKKSFVSVSLDPKTLRFHNIAFLAALRPIFSISFLDNEKKKWGKKNENLSIKTYNNEKKKKEMW